MMSQFTNPPPAPNRGDRATFSGRVDAFLKWLVSFVAQLNIFASNLNARDAGGAATFPFTFDSSIVDGDPGSGKIKFDSSNQSSSLTIRIDNITDSNIDVGSFITSIQNVTSNTKGSIRIEKAKTPGVWILFDITSVVDKGGYKNLSVVSRASSSASPFLGGDGLVVYFDRNGDRGDGGNTPSAQQIREAVGILPVTSGGSGANTANQALANLGAVSASGLAAPDGAKLIGFSQAGNGTAARNVLEKLFDSFSVADYGADRSGSFDSTSSFEKAPDGSFVPNGTYKMSKHISDRVFYSLSDVTFTGYGSAKVINLVSKNDGGAFTALDDKSYANTGLEYKSEASMVVTKTGLLLAFYRVGASHVNGSTNVTSYVVCKQYNRNTNTWENQRVIDSAQGYDTRNQVAGINEATGRIFCFYCQNQYDSSGNIIESTRRTYMKYSDDNGATWSARVNIGQYCTFPNADNVPFGKVISFATGDLLISLYNYHTIFTLKSSDNGLTWGNATGSAPNVNPNLRTLYTTPNIQDDNYTEPTIVKISEKELVCISRSIYTGFVKDGTVVFRYIGRKWQANTYYQEGQYVYVFPDRVYLCTGSGTSGATEPTQTEGTYQNGTAVFQGLGGYAVWSANATYSTGMFVETYSSYMYQVSSPGTTSTTAPLYSKLADEEPEMAYFKSYDGGQSWSSAQTVKWTNETFHVTNSPASAVVVGGTVHIAWFSRSPLWNLYYVKMSARAFFENPAWAFSRTDGEPRSRLMRSFLYSQNNSYGYRINTGYVNLERIPNSLSVMAAWYDQPDTAYDRVNIYSTIIQP